MKKALIAALLAGSALMGWPQIGSAHADAFLTCPSGHVGVATNVTSCEFADDVREAWFGQPGNPVLAYSPVTGQVYSMACNRSTVMVGGLVVNGFTCYGGNHAEVVVW